MNDILEPDDLSAKPNATLMARARYRDLFPVKARLFASPAYEGAPNRKFGPGGMRAASSFEDLKSIMHGFDRAGKSCWNGVAGYLPNATVATRNTIHSIKGFWHDIDLLPGGTKSGALKALASLCAGTSLPRPNIVVDSGNGLHCYWILETAIPFDIWKPIANDLKIVIRTSPVIAKDVSRISDAVSVLRFPGTHNRKDSQNIKTVHVVPFDPSLMEWGLFDYRALATGLKREADKIREKKVSSGQMLSHSRYATVDNELLFVMDKEMAAIFEAAMPAPWTPEKLRHVLETASRVNPLWRESFYGEDEEKKIGRTYALMAAYDVSQGLPWGLEVLTEWLLETEPPEIRSREERWRQRTWEKSRDRESELDNEGTALYGMGSMIDRILMDDRTEGIRLKQLIDDPEKRKPAIIAGMATMKTSGITKSGKSWCKTPKRNAK